MSLFLSAEALKWQKESNDSIDNLRTKGFTQIDKLEN